MLAPDVVAYVRAALGPWFATAEPVRGTYTYRWHIPPELRAEEERPIARGELPAGGARFVAQRSRRRNAHSAPAPTAAT